MSTPLLVPLVPPVLLLGPSGAGKSTLAPLVAARLGFQAIDLDDRARAFDLHSDGLPRLRVREHLALRAAVDEGAVVVATGAGVIDVVENHPLLRRGVVVVVDIDADSAVGRLRDEAHRPWLPAVGDPHRTGAWRERENDRARRRRALADIVVDGRGPLEQVAAAIEAAVRGYRIRAPDDDDIAAVLDVIGVGNDGNGGNGGNGSVVTADRAIVDHLRHSGVVADVVVDVTDDKKRFALVEQLLGELVRRGVTRSSTIVGVGGGLLLDVVGLVAALHHRGTAWRSVPTTLLAMVDAGIGGKTAVDLVVDGVVVRNAAGRFHPPISSHVWPGFLTTLSVDARRHGRAEMLKHVLLGAGGDDEDSARSLAASRGFKAAVVARDPEERHLRQLLNLGHTLAHALESRFAIAHGDAVLHGLRFAAQVSTTFAGLDGAVWRMVEARVASLSPPPLPALGDDDRTALRVAMSRDKKRAGRFVLLQAPGRAVIATIEADAIDEALRRL